MGRLYRRLKCRFSLLWQRWTRSVSIWERWIKLDALWKNRNVCLETKIAECRTSRNADITWRWKLGSLWQMWQNHLGKWYFWKVLPRFGSTDISQKYYIYLKNWYISFIFNNLLKEIFQSVDKIRFLFQMLWNIALLGHVVKSIFFPHYMKNRTQEAALEIF